MGPDVEVSQSRAVGQGKPERGFESALSPARFEDVGDGAGAEGVSFEGVVDGGGEFLRPVVVEQREQPGAMRSQRLPAFCEPFEEGGGGGDGGAEPVAGGVDVGLAGELGLLVEDADAGGAGEQRQGLADVGVGDGVEIAVEADVGGLAGADDAHEVGLEGMGGAARRPRRRRRCGRASRGGVVGGRPRRASVGTGR